MSRLITYTTLTLFSSLLTLGLLAAPTWVSMPNAEQIRSVGDTMHIRVTKPIGTDTVELIELQTISHVSTENIPDELKYAVVASEDYRFYTRTPTYMIAKMLQATLFCVAKKTVKSNSSCVGNSAITQQLIKLVLVSQHRSVKRKVLELLGAIKIESQLSKDGILGLYLNRAYFGNGNYGVGLAARYYFGKIPIDLTLEECVLLAAIIQNPRYDPLDQPNENRERANLILALMHKHGFLEQATVISDDYVIAKGDRRAVKAFARHQWFWLKDEIKELLRGKPHGEYKVWTTLDPEIQIYAQTRLKQIVSETMGLKQGAVVVMRHNGEVLAMVGGTGGDMKSRGTNRVIRNRGLFCPQSGSTMKLVTYLTGIESGLNPDSIVDASPFAIDDYVVENYNGEVFGQVSMRVAFYESINTAAVRILHEIGYEHWRSVAERLGLPISLIKNELGIAIGQSEMCLIELTSAYATVANNGINQSPYGVIGIAHMSGDLIWKKQPRTPFFKEFRGKHIMEIDSMLRAVVIKGTGRHADTDIDFLSIRGKTGTADDSKGASFIGYTRVENHDDLVVGVWLGNDVPVPIQGLVGGGAPARLFNYVLYDIATYTKYLPRRASATNDSYWN